MDCHAVGSRSHIVTLHPESFKDRISFYRWQLTELSLVKTGLMDDGVLAIVRAMSNGNTSLAKLDLSANNVGNKSAAAIGDLFESNHSLRELNLSWNTIKASNPLVENSGFDLCLSSPAVLQVWQKD